MGRRFTWCGASVVAVGAALLCLWCSLSVGAAVDVAAADSGDPCAKFNSCTACAAVRQHAAQPLQCGWCQTPQGGTCSNGTSTGPTNGTCDGASTWYIRAGAGSSFGPWYRPISQFVGLHVHTLLARYWESDTCAALCTGLTTAGCDRCTANAVSDWLIDRELHFSGRCRITTVCCRVTHTLSGMWLVLDLQPVPSRLSHSQRRWSMCRRALDVCLLRC